MSKTIFEELHEVLANHEMTFEELAAMASQRTLTADEFQLMEELKQAEDANK